VPVGHATLHRRIVGTDGDGVAVLIDGIAVNQRVSHDDLRIASGIDYEYRWEPVGTAGGTRIDALWTASTEGAQAGNRWVSVGADANWTADEIKAGTNSSHPALPIPNYTGRRRVVAARPASLGPFTAVYLYLPGHRNTFNQISAWTRGTLNIDGVAHNLIWSVPLLGAGGYILETV